MATSQVRSKVLYQSWISSKTSCLIQCRFIGLFICSRLYLNRHQGSSSNLESKSRTRPKAEGNLHSGFTHKMKEEKVKQKFHLPPHLNQTHEGMYYVNCKMNIIHIQLPKRQQCVVYKQIKASRNEVRIIFYTLYHDNSLHDYATLMGNSGKLSFHE